MKILTTILLLAAMPALADTITTISGTTYSDATVTKTTPRAIEGRGLKPKIKNLRVSAGNDRR